MKSDGLEFVRALLARGQYTFLRQEAAQALSRSGPTLNKVLQRLRRAEWLLPLGKDLFAIVDPQNRNMGSIPPSWFIEAWARHRGVEYYVGGLTAADWHGAAHQRPQVFQVVVNKAVRGFKLPSGGLQLLFRHKMAPSMWEQKKVPTGYVRVSTPEMTAYDLLSLRTACPSLDHATTVLIELGASMRATQVAALSTFGELSTLQRLGWLLDRAGWSNRTSGLARAIQSRSPAWTPLLPGGPRSGSRNPKWHVLENTDIQPDLEPAGSP